MSTKMAARQRNSTTSSTSKQTSAAATISKTQPPAPFSTAPTSFSPLLELLDTEKVYIIHLDQFPWQFKRKIFAVPVLLNLTISVLLIWRAWHAGPMYVGMFSYLASAMRAEAAPLRDSWTGFALLVVKRALIMLIDSVLARVIFPWPITFFFEGPANPCLWRWNVGFHDTEVVVRVSRGWGAEDLMGKGKAKRGEDSPFWKTRVLPGVAEPLLKEKTGYALMGKDWDLEFRLMIAVTAMVEQGKFGWGDLKPVVLAWAEGDGWVAWRVWGHEDKKSQEEGVMPLEPGQGPPATLSEADQTAGWDMMEKFKTRLVSIGKEDLWYRSVELMQYEASLGPDLTPERQRVMAGRVKDLFEQNGLNYDEFMTSMGMTA